MYAVTSGIHDALAESDYDALYVAVGEQMPRITRQQFPGILAQLIAQGVLEMTVTESEIAVRMPAVPETGVYRVQRK